MIYKKESYIDDYDTLGISVMDLMHNDESGTYFNKNNQGLKEVAKKILFDNNFEVSVKPVKTLNTTSYGQSTILRVKHVNSDFSEDYKDAIGTGTDPIVFSGGIFSNLEIWEGETSLFGTGLLKKRTGLAKQMSDEGWDVWEIEMTGGPYTDCAGFDEDTCPDYTYNDLVDYYWPALIAGIQEYSTKNQIDYVGHSNGGRVALSSLNEYSLSGKNNAGYYFDYQTGEYVYSDLSSQPVDKYVGLGVPAVLNDESYFIESARNPKPFSDELSGDYAIRKLNESGKPHITKKDYSKLTNPLGGRIFVWGGSKISLNLMDFYNDLAIDGDSSLLVDNVDISKLYLIYGKRGYTDIFSPNGNNDGIVPIGDASFILNSVSSPLEELFDINDTHSGIFKNELSYNYIKGVLR